MGAVGIRERGARIFGDAKHLFEADAQRRHGQWWRGYRLLIQFVEMHRFGKVPLIE